MVKPIYLYGSEVLRDVAAPADLSDKAYIDGLVADLKDTLAKAEGCGLAAPQIGESVRVLIVDGYCDVARPDSMTVEYYDENLEKKTETFDKFACRMVQHEMSHLDGDLFVDHVPPIRKKIISKKLMNISKGRVPARYITKIK